MRECPFCGGLKFQKNTKAKGYFIKKQAEREGKDTSNHLIRCTACGAKGPLSHSPAEAEDAWNRRPNTPTAPASEPVAWLPTETVRWLEDYGGPACATRTAVHNRPIKSDGGVPVYLHPVHSAPHQPPSSDDSKVEPTEFENWLNEQRDRNVSEVFHELVAKFKAMQDAGCTVIGAAYLAGFNASSEGWNGEFPFADSIGNPEDNPTWVTRRDKELKEIK